MLVALTRSTTDIAPFIIIIVLIFVILIISWFG